MIKAIKPARSKPEGDFDLWVVLLGEIPDSKKKVKIWNLVHKI